MWIVRSNLSNITQHSMVFSIKLFGMFLANVNINLNHKLMKLGERVVADERMLFENYKHKHERSCIYKEKINKNFLLKFSQKGWSLRTFFSFLPNDMYNGAPNTHTMCYEF